MLEIIEPIGQIPMIGDLANRPNDPIAYGGNGLGAAALKARFDALPQALREKVNALLVTLGSTDGASYIGLPPVSYAAGTKTIASVGDFAAALADTGLAELLMVQTDDTPCSLQSLLQTHSELHSQRIVQVSVKNGILKLHLANEETLSVPLVADTREEVLEPILELWDGASSIATCDYWLKLNLPLRMLAEQQQMTYETETRASALLQMTQTLPQVGTVCYATYGERCEAAMVYRTDDGVAMRLPDATLSLSMTSDGVVAVLDTDAPMSDGAPKLSLVAYVPCHAKVRLICKGDTDVEFPPHLYAGDVPQFTAGSVWDLAFDSGILTAREFTTAEAVAAREALRIEARVETVLAEVANDTY